MKIAQIALLLLMGMATCFAVDVEDAELIKTITYSDNGKNGQLKLYYSEKRPSEVWVDAASGNGKGAMVTILTYVDGKRHAGVEKTVIVRKEDKLDGQASTYKAYRKWELVEVVSVR